MLCPTSPASWDGCSAPLWSGAGGWGPAVLRRLACRPACLRRVSICRAAQISLAFGVAIRARLGLVAMAQLWDMDIILLLQGGDALLQGRVAHEQLRQPLGQTAGDAEGGQSTRQGSGIMQTLEALEGADHVLWPRQPCPARVGPIEVANPLIGGRP